MSMRNFAKGYVVMVVGLYAASAIEVAGMGGGGAIAYKIAEATTGLPGVAALFGAAAGACAAWPCTERFLHPVFRAFDHYMGFDC